MILVRDMVKALEQFRKQGMSVPSEFHVHPDDWDDLKKQVIRFPSDTPKNSFLGVKIIIDANAERLPRKPAKGVK
jgi:hypothetical protein